VGRVQAKEELKGGEESGDYGAGDEDPARPGFSALGPAAVTGVASAPSVATTAGAAVATTAAPPRPSAASGPRPAGPVAASFSRPWLQLA
jgi:hypothetical protein